MNDDPPSCTLDDSIKIELSYKLSCKGLTKLYHLLNTLLVQEESKLIDGLDVSVNDLDVVKFCLGPIKTSTFNYDLHILNTKRKIAATLNSYDIDFIYYGISVSLWNFLPSWGRLVRPNLIMGFIPWSEISLGEHPDNLYQDPFLETGQVSIIKAPRFSQQLYPVYENGLHFVTYFLQTNPKLKDMVNKLPQPGCCFKTSSKKKIELLLGWMDEEDERCLLLALIEQRHAKFDVFNIVPEDVIGIVGANQSFALGYVRGFSYLDEEPQVPQLRWNLCSSIWQDKDDQIVPDAPDLDILHDPISCFAVLSKS